MSAASTAVAPFLMVKKRGTKTAMARRSAPALDEVKLRELALAYVGRFATTRARLRAYLNRKIRERGWGGAQPPDVQAISERFAEQGYIDDSGYAMMKARALSGRGYGKQRVLKALRGAGVAGEDSHPALDHADEEAVAAALRFAQRRRIGPFALAAASDPRDVEKGIGAMVRAGHSFGLARAIVQMEPGTEIDLEALANKVH